RVDPCSTPVCSPDVPGQLDGAALGGRSEQRTVIKLLQHLERLRSQLRCEVDHIVVLKTWSIECRRLRGKWLRLRRLFARRRGLRNRALFDRPDGRAGLSIENV